TNSVVAVCPSGRTTQGSPSGRRHMVVVHDRRGRDFRGADAKIEAVEAWLSCCRYRALPASWAGKALLISRKARSERPTRWCPKSVVGGPTNGRPPPHSRG